METFTIIIPTLGRGESLKECLNSIEAQTFKDWMYILVTDEGKLSELRNNGARQAQGKYLIFIDDDIVCSRGWLAALKRKLDDGFSGVSGPAYIESNFRIRRDIFKFDEFTKLFSHELPGHLSSWGMHSMAAAYYPCDYDGPVEYLEACNMAFKHEAFLEHGGFDESYGGVGEWCEPDLCFKLRKNGHRLWFARDAVVEHRPSQSGAYPKRLNTGNRMENYELFSQRWIPQTAKHRLFKGLMKTYFTMKENRWI